MHMNHAILPVKLISSTVQLTLYIGIRRVYNINCRKMVFSYVFIQGDIIMMNIPFSPPDITEEEIAEVVDTLRSGWITTGPKTKFFEQKLSASPARPPVPR